MKPQGWTHLLAAALLLAAPALAGGEPPIVYEVASLKGKLIHESTQGDHRLAAGEQLAGGERLRSGWFSACDLTAPDFGSRFHLGSRTRVRLASDAPGVLLELERGRLRALFDELLGREPIERQVRTPSAILAVRGTEYGVAVSRSGETTLVVFVGTVEVFDREGRAAPVVVEPGFAVHVRRGQPPGAPYAHGVTSRGWDRGAMPGSRGPMSPGMGSGPGGSRARPSGHGHGHGG